MNLYDKILTYNNTTCLASKKSRQEHMYLFTYNKVVTDRCLCIKDIEEVIIKAVLNKVTKLKTLVFEKVTVAVVYVLGFGCQ